MAEGWIIPTQLFDNGTLQSGMAVQVVDGRTTDLRAVAAVPPDARRQVVPGVLTPGFVDLQVNGGGGVLLNHAPTCAGLMRIATAHRAFGTVAVMPTLITDAPEVLAKARRLKHTMKVAKKKKEERVRKHVKEGSMGFVNEKSKKIVKVVK